MIARSFFVKICDIFIKYAIYGGIFLIPIFFASPQFGPLDFIKQSLLIFFVAVSAIAWTLKGWIKNELNLNIRKTYAIAAIIFFLTYFLSTIFSVSRSASFWGIPQAASTGFVSIIFLLILYFLIGNDFSKKEIFSSFIFLSSSIFTVNLYGILQLAGIAPFDFAKAAFSPVGAFSSLGLIAAVILPLQIVIFSFHKTPLKFFGAAATVLSFIVFLMVNYYPVWIAVLIGCVPLVLFWTAKKSVFGAKPIFIPVFFIFISLFFIIFSPQIRWLPQKPAEILLSSKAGIKINSAVMGSNPIFGSGPATFFYDFKKHKEESFNKTVAWSVGFVSGSSKILTALAEIGIVGTLSLVLFFVLPVLISLKSLIFSVPEENANRTASLTLAAASVLLTGLAGYFLLNSGIVLDFICVFSAAALIAISVRNEKIFILSPSSSAFVIFTAVSALIFVFGGGLMVLESRRFLAEASYGKAIIEWQSGNKDKGMEDLKEAIDWNGRSDIYHSQMALFYLDKFLFSSAGTRDVQILEGKELAGRAANSASAAIEINPNNSANWAVQGQVCLNLIGFIESGVECALKSYDKAIALDPSNPYLFLQKGAVYFSVSEKLPKQGQERVQALSLALEMFKKSAELKNDYALAYLHAGLVYYEQKEYGNAAEEFKKAIKISPKYGEAMYYLALSYYRQGLNREALIVFSEIFSLFPDNQNIRRIIDNLKDKKDIFEAGEMPRLFSPQM